MNYLIFLGFEIGGFLFIRYFKWIVDHTTRYAFFENFLGSGGSYTAIKLAGILLVIAGIYILFNPIV